MDCQEFLKAMGKSLLIFRYVLRQVKVVEYDKIQMKYKVMFIHTETFKYVSRLSLQFFSEVQSEFEFRKNICERRRSHVDEFLMFTRYTDNVPLGKITQLSSAVYFYLF